MFNQDIFETSHDIRHDQVVSAYLGGKTVAELQEMFPQYSESEIHQILARGHSQY
jgi:hypothetical protein